MEGREVLVEDRVEQEETDTGEALEERRFKVGELVEYWGGAMVRGTGLIAGNRHGRSQIMGEVFMGLRW